MHAAPAIRAEALGKRYTLGWARKAKYRTLSESLHGAAADLYRRLRHLSSSRRADTEFWALRDVSFDIPRGGVTGVIGRNGAGKSTLLKILSRVTEPTTGRVTLRGRVASLLEVGTGFHSQLSGRENIFLNGSLLGMQRREIKRKFDEIVAFAEVERFLDTPVKHYSSGMYMRLAFAVAAHLESEILIVDEVLAVGDLEFQRRCLGKMNSIATREGRTVLFVSHNLGTVRALCSQAILLRQGQVLLQASAADAVTAYLAAKDSWEAAVVWEKAQAPAAHYVRFRAAFVLGLDGEPAHDIDSNAPFELCLEYEVLAATPNLRIGFSMQTADGTSLCGSNDENINAGRTVLPGVYRSRCRFPGHVLNAGLFFVAFSADVPASDLPYVQSEFCLRFRVADHTGHGPRKEPVPGIIRPDLVWRGETMAELPSDQTVPGALYQYAA